MIPTIKRCFVLLAFLLPVLANAQTLPIKGGHSHNDYYRARPLLDALDNGMVSIEADVYLKNGEILVGHDEKELDSSKSLEILYLKPLFELYNQGKLDSSRLILLIDIKKDGEDVYTELRKILEPYLQMLTIYSNDRTVVKEITLILSGDRPVETVRNESERYVFIDGRINNTDIADSSNLIPLISDNWNKHFKWRGKGEISPKEFQKLQNVVRECHEQNKIIRFWAIPGEISVSQAYWETLIKTHVDLLGCDCPRCLRSYIESL